MTGIRPIRPNVVPLRPVPATDWEGIVADWLKVKRSPHTRRAYRNDLNHFLADGLTLGHFLGGDRQQAYELISRHRGQLLEAGCSPATINRRLSTIKSFANFCYQCGHTDFMLDSIKLERHRNYRDTSGIDAIAFKDILATCDDSIMGRRDFAILSLLWANALRRSEVCQCNVSDFDGQQKTLRIFGKGRGNESETIFLGDATKDAISVYLGMRSPFAPADPLFVAHKPGYQGRRLSTNSIYKVVKGRSELAGIAKPMSPHRIRHSSITAALDLTNGDVRRVQKLSRHSNLNTLLIYDDNRKNAQREVSEMLDGLF